MMTKNRQQGQTLAVQQNMIMNLLTSYKRGEISHRHKNYMILPWQHHWQLELISSQQQQQRTRVDRQSVVASPTHVPAFAGVDLMSKYDCGKK